MSRQPYTFMPESGLIQAPGDRSLSPAQAADELNRLTRRPIIEVRSITVDDHKQNVVCRIHITVAGFSLRAETSLDYRTAAELRTHGAFSEWVVQSLCRQVTGNIHCELEKQARIQFDY